MEILFFYLIISCSNSKFIPSFSSASLCTSFISFIISSLFAFPLLIIKLACFVEMYASFTLCPFKFSLCSISAPALILSGFLNTLPAFGYSNGCVFILFSMYSFILSCISFLFDGFNFIFVLIIIMSLFFLKQLFL